VVKLWSDFSLLNAAEEQNGRDENSFIQPNSLSLESCFDLAYNPAHALALAALRWNGYRSDNRYIFFSVCLIPWG